MLLFREINEFSVNIGMKNSTATSRTVDIEAIIHLLRSHIDFIDCKSFPEIISVCLHLTVF